MIVCHFTRTQNPTEGVTVGWQLSVIKHSRCTLYKRFTSAQRQTCWTVWADTHITTQVTCTNLLWREHHETTQEPFRAHVKPRSRVVRTKASHRHTHLLLRSLQFKYIYGWEESKSSEENHNCPLCMPKQKYYTIYSHNHTTKFQIWSKVILKVSSSFSSAGLSLFNRGEKDWKEWNGKHHRGLDRDYKQGCGEGKKPLFNILIYFNKGLLIPLHKKEIYSYVFCRDLYCQLRRENWTADCWSSIRLLM